MFIMWKYAFNIYIFFQSSEQKLSLHVVTQVDNINRNATNLQHLAYNHVQL